MLVANAEGTNAHFLGMRDVSVEGGDISIDFIVLDPMFLADALDLFLQRR